MFITFEGPEGAGKSSAMRVVAERLRSEGRRVVTTREPGDGPVGPAIREILLHSADLDARTELFLFLADRAQHVAGIIRPALEERSVVLCDRFSDSTVVYQAHARGLDAEQLRQLNRFATNGLAPDLTLLLDLEPESGLARLQSKDRLDAEPIEFHRKVRDGFLKEAEREPDRWVRIDASQTPDKVADDCLNAIWARMP